MSKTVILVPVYSHCEPETDEVLQELSKDFQVIRSRGVSEISMARARLASRAIRMGFENLIWIDSDILFTEHDFERLLSSPGFRCAPYAIKNVPGKIAVKGEVYEHTTGLVEIEAAGFGFVQTPVEIYLQMMKDGIPSCRQGDKEQLWPFFQPRWWKNPDGSYTYFGEDYSFCLHARTLGFKLMCDFDIRIGHIGRKAYYAGE